MRNFRGPFQKHSEEILGLIPPEQPAFVFIDPFGYRGIELDEVLKFVSRRWNEVFITFMTDTIGRYMNDRNKASGMDRVFGTTDWRRIAESPTANQKDAAVELHCSQIQAKMRHDKPTYVFPINVAYEDRASDIYHLLHVSHHPKARVVMESAINRADHMSMEQKLFIAPEIQEHAMSALRGAPGRRMTALNLAGAVWQRLLYPSWRSDIKEAIRGLEASGEVDIRTHNDRNRKKGGIEEKDIVCLRGGH